ncbi:SDR family NAD(P)-dependent oxidoreductase [Streptomyces montanus]|uniref:SDR family NAD(P)-dependent oxidoreductase n=1 Tax=Streptomyces montanus TaxID=2580423 RepID=A0A5R9G0J0_9ACTN|nr:SDR family NAD(P)-dependent oxidoreductase [Streptomyces montanus]
MRRLSCAARGRSGRGSRGCPVEELVGELSAGDGSGELERSGQQGEEAERLHARRGSGSSGARRAAISSMRTSRLSAKAVLPHMRAQAGGRVINISSILGLVPAPYMAVYAASKHAVRVTPSGKDGDDPAVVAKAIVAAATDSRPKLRYAAGPNARRISTARRMFPARAFDQQIRKFNKLAG